MKYFLLLGNTHKIMWVLFFMNSLQAQITSLQNLEKTFGTAARQSGFGSNDSHVFYVDIEKKPLGSTKDVRARIRERQLRAYRTLLGHLLIDCTDNERENPHYKRLINYAAKGFDHKTESFRPEMHFASLSDEQIAVLVALPVSARASLPAPVKAQEFIGNEYQEMISKDTFKPRQLELVELANLHDVSLPAKDVSKLYYSLVPGGGLIKQFMENENLLPKPLESVLLPSPIAGKTAMATCIRITNLINSRWLSGKDLESCIKLLDSNGFESYGNWLADNYRVKPIVLDSVDYSELSFKKLHHLLPIMDSTFLNQQFKVLSKCILNSEQTQSIVVNWVVASGGNLQFEEKKSSDQHYDDAYANYYSDKFEPEYCKKKLLASINESQSYGSMILYAGVCFKMGEMDIGYLVAKNAFQLTPRHTQAASRLLEGLAGIGLLDQAHNLKRYWLGPDAPDYVTDKSRENIQTIQIN